jgi:hypothetical protein
MRQRTWSAQSLHWDLRGLAALRLPPSARRELAQLAADEVEPVRQLALARLAGTLKRG